MKSQSGITDKNPIFDGLQERMGAMEVCAHGGAHFQLVSPDGSAG
jgi:hypothetical protein